MLKFKLIVMSPDGEQLFVETVTTDKSMERYIIDFCIEHNFGSMGYAQALTIPLNEAAEWALLEYENNKTKSMLGQLRASDLIMN